MNWKCTNDGMWANFVVLGFLIFVAVTAANLASTWIAKEYVESQIESKLNLKHDALDEYERKWGPLR